MKFPSHILDEIRARLPVSQVVGRHVQWDRRRSRPSRGDWWACCPFHHEKTPSFHADDRRGHYYCFGCHAKGDIFTFLVEKEGLTFPEAVTRLAEEAGVTLPKASAEEEEKEKRRASLHDVLETAARFYESRFWAGEGREARRYAMEVRELDAETLKCFRIGHAPDARDALRKHLEARGIDVPLMSEAGLVVVPEDGGSPYDRFRNRLMFPIRDARGRVIAFGGRALGEARAKYLNSPEGPLFHKSRVLYNLDRARGPALDRGEVIVVEGYMDVIALHRAGFPHAVAPLGTALTEEQLMLLWRLCPAPVLCLDGDAAGRKAAWRAVENALPRLEPGHTLKVAYLPEGRDPDDLLREEGPSALQTVLEGAMPLVEVIWREVIENSPMRTPEERAAVERRFEDLAALVQDPSVRAHYRREFRARLARLWRQDGRREGAGHGGTRATAGMKGARATARGRTWPARAGRGSGSGPVPGVSSRLKALSGLSGEAYHERQILKLVLRQPEILERVFEELAELPFTSPRLDSLRRKILDMAAAHPSLDSARLLAHLEKAGCGATARQLIGRSARADRQGEAPVLDLTHAVASFAGHAAAIRRTALLERELEAAERAFGEDPSEENLARINRIREELQAARALPGALKP